MMKKLFCVAFKNMHSPMIPLLKEQGYSVRYITCATAQIPSLEPYTEDCIIQEDWDAIRGEPAACFADAVIPPPSRDLIKGLKEHEGTILEILDRMNYDNFHIAQLRRVYMKQLGYWSWLLEKEQPAAVVFHASPHVGYDYVLYALCQYKKIPTIILEYTAIPDNLIVLRDLETIPEPPASLYDHLDEAPADTQPVINKEYYQHHTRNKMGNWKRHPWVSMCWMMLFHTAQFGRDLLVHLPHLLRKTDRPDAYYGLAKIPNWFWHIIRSWRSHLYRDWRRARYERMTVTPNTDEPYVFFPLHLQPEKSTIPRGTEFSDHLLVLQMVLQALPKNWKVIIKEHPRQFLGAVLRYKYARYGHFYDDLLACDPERVSFVSAAESSDMLLEHCQCAVTIAGTVGWEAVQAGKPAIIYGVPWYLHCPGIHRVSSVEDCRDVLQSVAEGTATPHRAAIAAYTEWFQNEGGFRGYFTPRFQSNITEEDNALSYVNAIVGALSSPSS